MKMVLQLLLLNGRCNARGLFSNQESCYNEAGTLDNQLEQIMLQKYYAYYFVDMQAWFEKEGPAIPSVSRGSGIPAENQFPFPLSVSRLPAVSQPRQPQSSLYRRLAVKISVR